MRGSKPGRSRLLALAGLAAGAVVVGVLVAVAVLTGQPTSAALPSLLPPDPVWTTPVRPQLDTVAAALSNRKKPVTIVVIGDSTSANATTNWVYLLGSWMGEKYDRPVTITPWSPDRKPPGWVDDVTPHAGGTGKPIHIWASGASGKGVDYATANLNDLLPEEARRADWIIVNHGHNALAGVLSGQVSGLLAALEKRSPGAVKTVTMQNPERPKTPNAANARENALRLGDNARYNGYSVIDVFTPFSKQPDYAKLLDGAIHPTPAGYRLWAKVVEDVLSD